MLVTLAKRQGSTQLRRGLASLSTIANDSYKQKSLIGYVSGAIAAMVAGCTIASAEESDSKGFKDRQISGYEDRIRNFSTPDKVFRYFATVEINKEVYMMPSDFVRAISPGHLQPKDLGLDIFQKRDESFGIIKERANKSGQPYRLLAHSEDGKVFDEPEKRGLISYGEFLFLLTIMSAPSRQFELAFKMFDIDGNGIVDLQEFRKVQLAVQSKTPSGRRLHMQDASAVNEKDLNHSLMLQRFFGQDGSGSLEFKDFKKFLHEIQNDLLHIDFLSYTRNNDDKEIIGETALAKMLLKYTRIKDADLPEYYNRIKEHYANDSAKGLTFHEVKDFFTFLRAIDEAAMALSLFETADAVVCEADFKRAAQVVSGVELSDSMIDFVFTLFDKDGDRHLSHSEFVNVLKQARARGLSSEKDLGFGRGFKGLVWCIKQRMKQES